MNSALHWERMWQHPCIYTRREGNKKCSLLQTELKGLMDHTAYLILKGCGPWEGPCHIVQLSAAVLSLCPWLRPAEERQTDGGRRKRRRAAASVGLAVATETMPSLLNTCFWWHHTAGLSTHDKGFCSAQSLNPETGHWCLCVCVCVMKWGRGGGGVVWDNDD